MTGSIRNQAARTPCLNWKPNKFISLTRWTSGGSREHGDQCLVSTKAGKISEVAEDTIEYSRMTLFYDFSYKKSNVIKIKNIYSRKIKIFIII